MASNFMKIEYLEDLLSGKLGTNGVIKNFSTKALTKPGDNYGSVIFAITIEVQNTSESTAEFHLVAKTSPETEWCKKVFLTSVTFKREIALYNEIIPTMVEFQQEQGMNNTISFIPEYYAGRVNLHTEVDDEAVMVLENLNYSGFEVVDRTEGFDFATTKLILQNLAEFHATSVALKISKPEVFNYKILRHLDSLAHIEEPFKEILPKFISSILEPAKINKECVPHVPRVLEAIQFDVEHEHTWVPREPFATLIHNDFWVNNMMVKFVGKLPLEIKFLDFQFITYSSPCADVVFFLYTSVPFEIVSANFEEFISIYYETFLNTLEKLKCDTEPFSYTAFIQEIKDSAKYQFWHIIRMLPPVLGPKGEQIDIHKLVEENTAVKEESCAYGKRLCDVILDFIKRDWI